jgi:hypothetical protein
MLLDRIDRLDRHVLELEGDDVDVAGERTQRVEVFIGGGDLDIGHLPGRRIVVGEKVWTR